MKQGGWIAGSGRAGGGVGVESNSTFRVRKRDLRKSHSQAPGARATPSRATHVATEGPAEL
jgi:hypothetical protein